MIMLMVIMMEPGKKAEKNTRKLLKFGRLKNFEHWERKYAVRI